MMRRAFVFCLFLLFAEQGQSQDAVKLSGQFTRLTFNGNGKPQAAWCSTNEFQIILTRDGRYSIQVDSLGKTDSVYLTFDGNDSYCVRYRSAVTANNPVNPNVNHSYVSSGSYPFASLDELKRAHMLWMVYGSGGFIHNLKTNTMPLPFLSARTNMKAYGFRLEHDLSAAPLYLPRQLRFIRDSSLDLSDVEEVNRPEINGVSEQRIAQLMTELNERKNEYRNGFLRGVMKVDQFTNYNGMEIPLSFSLKGYSPILKGYIPFSKNLGWEAIGRVTNVTGLASDAVSKESFLPPVLSRVAVHDSRFRFQDASRKLDQIIYGLEPGEKWMRKDSPTLQSIYGDNLKGLPISPRPVPPQLRKSTVLNPEMLLKTAVFLVSVFAISLFFFLRSRKKLNA